MTVSLILMTLLLALTMVLLKGFVSDWPLKIMMLLIVVAVLFLVLVIGVIEARAETHPWSLYQCSGNGPRYLICRPYGPSFKERGDCAYEKMRVERRMPGVEFECRRDR